MIATADQCIAAQLPINRLEPDALARLTPNLSVVDLEQREVLAETHQRIQKVYFPHTGIISCVVELVGGGAIETGMIGKDGVRREPGPRR
jgi:signal-transduction protein with cAMP-binding, CBS, and nucleotidyltransferase domain